MMEELDCVVIGAGLYGLACGKQYHVHHPDRRLAVLDTGATIGGVWAEQNLYPGVKTNNLLGTYEYPDFPMKPEIFGVQPGEHIPGRVLNTYLEAYARHFGFFDRIRLKTRVLSAEHKPEGGWLLTVSDESEVAELPVYEVFTRRLIVATGLTSEPFLPRFEGQEMFGSPLFHSKDLLKNIDTMDPARTKRVTVFGGTKSAWDAVYGYGMKGIHVDWVIRASGHGTCWAAPPYVTPLRKWLEKLVTTRLITWFSPCIWAEDGGYSGIRSFWHGTAIGRAITNGFWHLLGTDVIKLIKYDSHPETTKLKPWTEAFHTGCSFNILNYETDFFELVRSGQVKVHIADISHLSPRKVHLADADKTVLDSDAFVCVTGWKHVPPLKFLPEGIEKELGLPHFPSAKPSDDDLASDQHLLNKADAEITTRFPRLKQLPIFNRNFIPLAEQKGVSVDKNAITPTSKVTPFMLYHFITPPQPTFLRAKDVAFSGFNRNLSNSTTAHLQGLWISAFFDGKLVRDPSDAVLDCGETGKDKVGFHPTLDELRYETVLHNRMGKWRYPTDHGSYRPDFVFEGLSYIDMLLADLGLRVHRKGGWLGEMTEPYGVEDYRDVNEEWEALYASGTANGVRGNP